MSLEKNSLQTPRQLGRRVEAERLQQKFFEPIVEGFFIPEQIETRCTAAGETLVRTPESEKYIEEKWQEVLAGGFKPWPNDTKPSRYRFVGAEVKEGKLVLTLDPTVSYKDAATTRSKDFAERFGEACAPNPVAVTTVLIAKDSAGKEHMLMTLRNESHDFKPGGYHISVGGAMEIKKDANPIDTCLREMNEEVGLAANELHGVMCVGVVKHSQQSATEIIFEARTNVPLEEILKRNHDDENTVVAIPTTPSELRRWIVVPTFANVCVTSAAVLMVGTELVNQQYPNGDGTEAAQWHREMLDLLAARSDQFEKATPAEQAELEKRDVERLRVMLAAQG